MAPAAAQKRLDLLDGKLGAAGADSVVLSRVHPMVVARRRRVPAIFLCGFYGFSFAFRIFASTHLDR